MGIVCPGGQKVGDQKSGDQMGSGPNASQPIIEGPNYLDVQYRNINKIILFKNNFLINPNQKTTENFVKTIMALLSISPDLNLVKDWFPQHEK